MTMRCVTMRCVTMLAMSLLAVPAVAQTFPANQNPGWVSKTLQPSAPQVTATQWNQWFGKKPDAVSGQMLNPTIRGGSVSGSDVGAALVNSVALSAVIGTTQSAGPSVFLGGVSNTESMADPVAMRDVLASGKIGLYVHPFAPNFTWYQPGQAGVLSASITPAITSLFSQAGLSMIELGASGSPALTELTVTNATASAITIPVNTAFSDQAGNGWLSQLPGFYAPFTNADETHCADANYHYVVPANATCQLVVAAPALGAFDVPANAFTQSPLSGLSITGSLPIVPAAQQQSGTTYGREGQTTSGTAAGQNFATGGGFTWPRYHGWGVSAAIAAVNIDNATSEPAWDATWWQQYVDAVRAGTGIKVVAPILQPSAWYRYGGLSADFAADPFMTTFRAQALYGGGIAFDAPPNYALRALGASYLPYYETMIRWARAQGLEVIWIVSQDGDDGTHTWPNMASNTRDLVARLRADDALPTRWAVENYASAGFAEDCTALGTANDTTRAPVTGVACTGSQAGQTPATYAYKNSLNAIALFLAGSVGTAPPPPANASLTSTGALLPQPAMTLSGHAVRSGVPSVGDLGDGAHVLMDYMLGRSIPTLDIGGTVQAPGGVRTTGAVIYTTTGGGPSVQTYADGSNSLNVTWWSAGGTVQAHGYFDNAGQYHIGQSTYGSSMVLGSSQGSATVQTYADASGSLNFVFYPNTGANQPSHAYFDAGGSLHANVSADRLVSDPSGSGPAHSSSTCTTGQSAWDATYEYRCVAPNSWQRWARNASDTW